MWNFITVIGTSIGAGYGFFTGDLTLAVTFLNTGLIVTAIDAILSGQTVIVAIPFDDSETEKDDD